MDQKMGRSDDRTITDQDVHGAKERMKGLNWGVAPLPAQANAEGPFVPAITMLMRILVAPRSIP